MRTTLKQSLATLAALAALMLSGTACTQDDPLGGNNPAGTHLLQLGKVTIAGTTTATRSADAATRADIAPDATTGFTGIRKHAFVAGDELKLTLTPPAGTGGSTPATVEVTATLSADGATWTLPQRTYFTAGTTIDARYTPATGKQPGGIRYSDDLVATNQKPLADGTPLALTLTHANAMVEVTPPASLTAAGTTYTNLTISATPADPSGNGTSPQQPEALATAQEGTGNDLRHRTIAPAGATLHSISLTVNTVVYTAPISPAVVVAANKRYPITLKMSAEEGLTASVAEGTDWTDGGDVEGLPTTYKYYISTPQDLVDFATAVNADATTDGSGARSATAIQTANIDMTGLDWTPIGINATRSFRGSYNGNGYSISNLTMIKTSLRGDNYMGLFGHIKATKITGVHLRDCNLQGSGGTRIYAGAIAGYAAWGNIITLCSATGSVEATASNTYAGGLSGYNPPNAEFNYYTRCNVDVDVTTTSVDHHYTCAFTGYSANVTAAACIASGTVTANNTLGVYSGFGYTNGQADPYRTIGCITNSEVTNAVKIGFGEINSILSCLATQPSYNSFCREATTVTDNVSLGSHTSSTTANPVGVSIKVKPADAYGLLTASNVASPIKIKTLHYSATEGYTTTVVEQLWYAKGIWKDNTGATNERPTIDMGYEGGAVPEPIQPGNKVYRLNGYWVTAPDVDETKSHAWSSNLNATTMASDPCAAAGNGWRMPSMKDYEVMLGLTASHPWSQDATSAFRVDIAISDIAAFNAVFPVAHYYWSSDINAAENTRMWTLYRVSLSNKEVAYMNNTTKNITGPRIRCVQKQAFPTP